MRHERDWDSQYTVVVFTILVTVLFLLNTFVSLFSFSCLSSPWHSYERQFLVSFRSTGVVALRLYGCVLLDGVTR